MSSLSFCINNLKDDYEFIDYYVYLLFLEEESEIKLKRSPNIHRPRDIVLKKIANLNEIWFRRNYRITRTRFYSIVDQLKTITSHNHHMAIVSSGSIVDPIYIIRLAITLRYLAGGSYLDICFGYEISSSSFFKIIYDVMAFITNTMNNISFPLDNVNELQILENEFSSICNGTFRGTVAAGDGVVFKMKKPNRAEVNDNVASFYSRKGYYAYGLQAFCSAKCRFLNISMKTCGSTHDGTSYILSDLSKAIRDNRLRAYF
mmetsp:Transcript_24697/g.22447  ORF Transcript_24697/g.22447 Transcript_24697/m.22447 type:complete len:260 (+) Transcript_24697:11-790(+)